MNEKYTYGYGLGWNVENEYINDLKELFIDVETQLKAIEDIKADTRRLESALSRPIEESQIREMYDRYYQGSSMVSYESVRASVLNEAEQRDEQTRRDIEHNRNKYLANVYLLIKIKDESRITVNQRKRELKNLLEQRRLELSAINLESERASVQYDENGNIANVEQRAMFRRAYDSVFLDIRKLEHALEQLEELSKSLEFTEEENALMLSGLNPIAQAEYDKIKKLTPVKPIPKTDDDDDQKTDDDDDQKTDDDDDQKTDDDDDQKTDDDDDQKTDDDDDQKTDDDDDQKTDDELNDKYAKALEIYKDLLADYNDELEELFRLQEAFENGQIEYSEYEKYADYMVQRYRDIYHDYEVIYNMKLEVDKYNAMTVEQLKNNLKNLIAQEEEIIHYYTHKGNGELTPSPEDEAKLAEIRSQKEKIKAEIIKRGAEVETPEKPIQPTMVLDKTIKEETKYYDLEELINKIRGPYEYKSLDGFIYRHKDIKCFNWNKKKERTLLDKPIRLVKTGISSIILGGSKLFSKIAYRREDIRERVEYCIEAVESLTIEEIKFLFEGNGRASATKLKELQNTIPDVAWQILYNRYRKIVYADVELANAQLKVHYNKIVSLYKRALEIQNLLNNEQLAPEERVKLEAELNDISKDLCTTILSCEEVYANIDNKLNASGLHGISENYRARRTNSDGGRNARYFDSKEGSNVGGIIGKNIRESLEKGDGIEAAKYFIYRHQVKIENTESKRTLKNRFGVASIGIYQYSPLVEQADYSQDEYIRDILQTIVIATSIINAVQQAALREELAQANQQIQMQNAEIARLNQDITTLKGMFAQYNADPDAFLATYYETLKNSLGGLQGTSEYLGLMAQAGDKTSMLISSGADYKLFDDYTHQMFGDLDRQLETIFNSTTLSNSDKILEMGKLYEQGVQEIARQAIAHSGNIQAHLAKFGQSYDFTSIASVLSTANTVDPSIVSNVFNDYVQAAIMSNNMQAMSYISTLDANVDLTVASVNLASIVGLAAYEDYMSKKGDNSEKTPEENIQEIKEIFMSVEIDQHEMAKKAYEEAMEEWNSKSAFYRWTHKKEKPKRIDYDVDVLTQPEEIESGRSL